MYYLIKGSIIYNNSTLQQQYESNKGVVDMLIGKEEVLMNVLWDYGKPMTSMDIIEAAPAGAWEEKNDKNVHRIIRQLLKKNMIKVCGQVQSGTQYARLFKPTISREVYTVNQMSSYDSDSMVRIAIGLTKAAKKKSDNKEGVSKEVIAELEKMVKEFKESNEDDNENDNGKT